jgi:predicted MFS family arabinose efflux permease
VVLGVVPASASRASRSGLRARATSGPRSRSSSPPRLIAAVPAAGYVGGVVPGGWRFVPFLYAVLLVVMGALMWALAPRQDRKPGSGGRSGRCCGRCGASASGASASTTSSSSAPT